MKVSIVTPSYNQVEFLETTIQSVLGQNYLELEYIIVDGGSTDGSVDIIKIYEDQLSWWVSEPDKGQASAINKGLKKATGDIVAWLNSDDVYAPGAVQEAVEIFRSHPEAVLVYGDAVSIDQDGKPFHYQEFREYYLEDLVGFHIICQPAVFIRKVTLESAGYLDESYHFLLDHQLWLRVAQYGEIHYVPDVWAFPRYHPGAKNIARSADFAKEALHLLGWMKEQPRLSKIITENKVNVMARYYRFSARYFLDAGMAFRALKHYGLAFRYYPRTALEEWNRMLFSILSVLGLGFLKKPYYQMKYRRYSCSKNKPSFDNVDSLFNPLKTNNS